MSGEIETYLLAENGKVRKIELTDGITNLFKKPMLEQIAIIDHYMIQLMVYASEQKKEGYSEKELEDLLEKHNFIYEMENSGVWRSSLDRLLNYGIFTKEYVDFGEYSEERYFLMPVFAEYFVDLRDEFGKGGPDLIEQANRLCGRLLMKDKFFETKNA